MPDVVLNTKHPGTESLNAIRDWLDNKFALKEDKTAGSFIIRLSFDPELIGQPWVLTGGTERYTGTVKSTPDDVMVNGIDDSSNPIIYTFATNTIEGIEIIRFFEFIKIEKYYPFGIYAAHITTDTTPPYAVDNLITYYDAINNTGTGHDSLATTWTDLSGNSNDGIITAGTWEDNALVLNGTNSCVKKDYNTGNINNISIEAYLASENTYSSGDAHIISKTVNDGCAISVYHGLVRFGVSSNDKGYVYAENNENIIAGIYNHYVGTFDGNTVKLYVNGKLINQKIASRYIISSNPTLSIGSTPNGGYYFNGKIRSFRMYYRALTEEEIKHNYSYERYRYELKGEVL